jgi:DNA invertase Pin-like site-specific DNA recombinase
MRAALYARVSTTDQDCSQQLSDLREYCTARGWQVQGEYVDHAISGTKATRPAMNQLMDAARRRAVDAIICWKIDRWGRSMPHFVQSVQELHALGIRFIAVTQGIDTDESNPTSRLMLNLLAAFAVFERELIVERTRAGLQRARHEGRIGGRPKLIVNRGKIIQMDAEGMTAREIAEELDISPASVCRILRTAGVTKRRGGARRAA